jgi:hypothetical protein
MKLTKSDITLNNTIGEIRFNNGYMDVKTMKFLKRDVSKHFITKFVRRDYVEENIFEYQLNQSHTIRLICKNEPDVFFRIHSTLRLCERNISDMRGTDLFDQFNS